ncbi:hypothetical protein ACNKHR_04890 [Shigella flexneri]
MAMVGDGINHAPALARQMSALQWAAAVMFPLKPRRLPDAP